MADTKISLLTDGVTANATDRLPGARAGANVYVTPAYIRTYILGQANTWADTQTLTSGKTLNWNGDTILNRDAAGTLALRNSTTAQKLSVYNTFTDSSNYERASFDWTTTANTLKIGASAAGTGTQRAVDFVGASFTFNGVKLPGLLLNVQVFTASGTYTRTTGCTKAYVRVIGGGGAGGGAAQTAGGFSTVSIGGGGGAGSTAEGYLSPAATETVTIGAGGTGVSASTGNTGGTSSFGTFVVATGGVGGTSAAEAASVNAPGGSGGTSSQSGTTSSVLGVGQAGVTGFAGTATGAFILNTGAGASTLIGSGGKGGIGTGVGAAGTGFGSGGAGSLTINASGAVAGGAGAPGHIIVWEFA